MGWLISGNLCQKEFCAFFRKNRKTPLICIRYEVKGQ